MCDTGDSRTVTSEYGDQLTRAWVSNSLPQLRSERLTDDVSADETDSVSRSQVHR